MKSLFEIDGCELFGFHGTNNANVQSILNNNFNSSENADDWLGKGVYFFSEGIGEPFEHAVEWARCQAYNRKLRRNTYRKYAVLKAKVVTDSLLDTTSVKGLNAFNCVRQTIIDRHSIEFQKAPPRQHDRLMWDFVADLMELEVVIHNLYIKDMRQRLLQIASNTPNVTVMCVKKNTIIDKSSIEKVGDGSTK